MALPYVPTGICYQYINYMNTAFLGRLVYMWADLSTMSKRKTIPLDSGGAYRVGVLSLTSAGQAAIPEPNIYILNKDYPRLDIIVPKTESFAAPLESHVLYFVGVTDDGVQGDIIRYIVVNNEPKVTNTNADALTKTWYNASSAIPLEEEFTLTYAQIAQDQKLMYALERMVVKEPVYSDTGSMYKYGIVSSFNILLKNKGVSENLISAKGYNSDFLSDLGIYKVYPPCWREKQTGSIFNSFTENDKISVKRSYKFNDNNTVNEYVVGYILDNIYSKIT